MKFSLIRPVYTFVEVYGLSACIYACIQHRLKFAGIITITLMNIYYYNYNGGGIIREVSSDMYSVIGWVLCNKRRM